MGFGGDDESYIGGLGYFFEKEDYSFFIVDFFKNY